MLKHAHWTRLQNSTKISHDRESERARKQATINKRTQPNQIDFYFSRFLNSSSLHFISVFGAMFSDSLFIHSRIRLCRVVLMSRPLVSCVGFGQLRAYTQRERMNQRTDRLPVCKWCGKFQNIPTHAQWRGKWMSDLINICLRLAWSCSKRGDTKRPVCNFLENEIWAIENGLSFRKH